MKVYLSTLTVILALVVSVSAVSAAPADRTATSSSAKSLSQAQTKASNQIDTRVESLNKLQERIMQIRNVSDAQKSAIAGSVQILVNNLNSLKEKIAAATSTEVAKADADEINKSNRVYALAIPQLNIIAASDRVITMSNMLTGVGMKLSERLAQASTSIANSAALQVSLTNISNKIKEAQTLAQEAVNGISQLVPDEGDKTRMASNTAALKEARTKVQSAHKSLDTARKEARTIIQALAKYDKTIFSGKSLNKVASSTNATSSATSTSR